MYYDLSISYPYLSLITPLSCYSLSFYAYSYLFSPIPIHFIGSHSSIRHRTQLLISIHSHLNTPYPLSSSQPLQSHSLLSIPISILSFHSIASFPFICYSSFDSSLSHVQLCLPPSLSSLHSVFTHSYAFHRFLSFFILIQCR